MREEGCNGGIVDDHFVVVIFIALHLALVSEIVIAFAIAVVIRVHGRIIVIQVHLFNVVAAQVSNAVVFFFQFFVRRMVGLLAFVVSWHCEGWMVGCGYGRMTKGRDQSINESNIHLLKVKISTREIFPLCYGRKTWRALCKGQSAVGSFREWWKQCNIHI